MKPTEAEDSKQAQQRCWSIGFLHIRMEKLVRDFQQQGKNKIKVS